MNFSKTLFSLALMLCSGLVASAQTAPLDINNNSSCYYLVKAIAIDLDCQNPCATTIMCVPPNSSVQLSPCGAPDLVWCNLQVTPADANCQPCLTDDGSPYATVFVAAPNDPCSSFPPSDSGYHCDSQCGTFNVDYHNPNTADIN